MKKTILVFGMLILALLLLFQLSKYAVISGDFQVEYIMTIIAVIFLVIGLFINKRAQKSSPVPKQEIELAKRWVELATAKIYDISDEDIQTEYIQAFADIKASYIKLNDLYAEQGSTELSNGCLAVYKELVKEFNNEYEL